jgi:hypothetical protein
VQQEDADPLAVGAARGFCGVGGLIDRDAHVPVEAERLDAEDVLGLPQRDVRHRQHRLGAGQRILARNALGRLPGAGPRQDVHYRLRTSS